MTPPRNKRLPPSILVCAVTLFCAGCSSVGKPATELTREPSIERALDILEAAPASRPLVRFLNEHPVRLEYSRTPGVCNKYSLKTGAIFLPRELRNSDALLALALARAVYIHRLHILSGLEDVISEEEEIAALFQARIGLALKLKEEDFKHNRFAKELRSDFCTYIMDGSDAAVLSARTIALSSQTVCRRPLEMMQTRRARLEETIAAVDNGSFLQLMKTRDLEKVRKGALTMNDAMKNDADLRSLPPDELYRNQHTFYVAQKDILFRLDRLYREALKDDELWRQANESLIGDVRQEFSACGLPE